MSRVHGIVKWFNKKQGYGFIHVLNGDNKEKDVFVHYSTIRSKDASDYKYLVQGEYVEFAIEKATKENHEFNAVDITGICEYPTLCETRRLALFHVEEGGEKREGEKREGGERERREGGERRERDRREGRDRREDRDRREGGDRREDRDRDGFQQVSNKRASKKRSETISL